VRTIDENGAEVAVPVRHQLSFDALFNLGVGSRWALGLAAPGVLYQQGNVDPTATWRPPTTALGDPTLEAKFVLVPKGELGGYGLSALSRVSIPLGSPESGIGDGAVTVQGRLLGELDLILLGLRASVGIKARTESRIFMGDQFGHTAPWAVGLVLKPQALGWDSKARWQWFVDAHGSVALSPEFATRHSSPIAIAASTRYALGGDMSLLSGVELPLNGALGAPSLRAVIGLSWAPRFLDADGDGIADDNDDCPEGMPEDRDGFEDDDGCPEDDNDNDAVPDAQDRCPRELEDLDGFEDEDGCPDLDNDKDSILDPSDACPDQAGVASRSKKYNGCPAKDSDGDGLLDDVDRCPEQAEDHDGRFDEDGCPDPDDDADGILDGSDDCPTQRGPRRDVPGLNGCPDPDTDGDTFYGTVGDAHASTDLLGVEASAVGTARDLCPSEAEDFDGDRDEDGCPDPDTKKPAPLINLDLNSAEGFVRFNHPLKWESATSERLAKEGLVQLRAVAKELRLHYEWSAVVGVRPTSTRSEDLKLASDRARFIVRVLQRLTLRDSSAQPGQFDEVARVPLATASGVGILFVNRSKPASDRGPKTSTEGSPSPGAAPAPATEGTKAPSPPPKP
jgi:hypothetical protein